MTAMSDWLARKSGQQQAPSPQYAPPQQWQQPPPQYYPQQPQYPQQYQQPYPQYAPPPPQYYQEPEVPLQPDGKVDVARAKAMFGKNWADTVTLMWKGGEATRTENVACPRCGNPLFSMRNTTGVVNSTTGSIARTAPLCVSCGYRDGGTFTAGDTVA